MSAAPNRTTPVLDPVVTPVQAPPQPPAKKGAPRWLIPVGLLLLGAVGAWVVLGRRHAQAPATPAAQSTIRTVAATLGTLQHVIRVSGQTSAIDFANITAPMLRGPDAGRDLILLKVSSSGTWVKKGEMVAQIDAQSLIDHVEDLADTIKTAEGDIRKRRAEQSIETENLLQSVRQAKADVDKARLEYAASETLTDIQRQLLKLTLDEQEARLKELQADIPHKQASQAAELKILSITLERHTRHRDRHTRDVKAFSIFASMDGLVVMQQIWRGSEMGQVQQGDRLSPGQPFMKIVNTKTMQVEGNVNQAESSDFRIGQKARIGLDAFKGLEFPGTVRSIGALAAGGYRNSYYVRNVPVRIAIHGHDPRLIPDLSAGADVVIDSAENQTIVPLGALRVEDGKQVVYVKAGQKLERRQVTTGLNSGTHVAIASGLKAGEVVQLD